MLPGRFLGDLTASYGGYVGVVVVPGGSFVVRLRGAGGVEISRAGVNEVRLVEDGWSVDSPGVGFPLECRESLDRSCFVAALQRVEWIRVEAHGRINEVLLDRTSGDVDIDHQEEYPEHPTGGSVERCECPEGYAGLSCQDPAESYYRAFPREDDVEASSWVDVVVGVARRCECHEKSSRCDPETGRCKNCTENTAGDHCELCDVGYYKLGDKCSPCPCPSAEHNNAMSCSPLADGFVCDCKKGYRGDRCDECRPGFYDKDRSAKAVECEPCGCNPHGTVAGGEASCDQDGRCACAEGFRGDKCDRCARPREVIVDGTCAPCDECSQLLFDDLDALQESVADVYASFQHGVAPPWKSLTDKLDRHRLLSDEFGNLTTRTDRLLADADVDGLEAKARRLAETTRASDVVAEATLSAIDGLYDNSSLIVGEADRLARRLSRLIGELDGFGGEEVSVDEALRRAHDVRSNLLEASEKMRRLGDDETSSYCAGVAERVRRLYRRNSTEVPDLADFLRRLNELIDVAARVESTSRLADGLNSRNAEALRRLRARLEEARGLDEAARRDVADVAAKIKAIDDVAARLRDVYDDLRRISEPGGEYDELEERTKRQMGTEPEVDELYLRAIEHVQELERKVEEYQSMFNFTRDEWRKINASGAYESIIAGVGDARRDAEAARVLLADAARIVDPAHSDRLVDKTNLAHAYSDRLRQRINNFNDVSKDFARVKNELDDLKYSILEDGRANNDLTQVLHRIESEITSQADRVRQVEEAIANGSAVSDEMTAVAKNVSELEFDKKHLFFKEYQNFLNLTTAEEINNLTNKLKYARRKLQDLNITTTDLDTIGSFNGHDVRSKIDDLRNKITYARQVADTVNVAMTLADCLMTYELRRPEFFGSLAVTYKCSGVCDVFKWSKASGDALRLYVEGGRTRLSVNGKEASLDEGGAKADRERTVEFRKTGSLLRVLVEGVVARTERVGNAFATVDPGDRLESGGAADATPGSYLVRMTLNDKNLGLWNFRTTEGRCKGQKRDRSDVPNATLMTYYTGDGYSVYGTNLGSSALNPQQLSWTFDLSTFDEDALVYLAVTEKCSQYVALYLEAGRARLAVRHDATRSVLLAAEPKLDDGRNYKLQATLSYDKSRRRQRYNLIVRSEEGVELANEAEDVELPRTGVFKIRQAVRYLGGVPPTFPAGCVPFGVGALLGFLKPQAPFSNETASYGVVHVDKKVLEFPNVLLLPVSGSRVDVAWRAGDVGSLSFVARPSTSSGLLFDFEDGSRVYLVERRIVVSVGSIEYLSSNVLVPDEYNEIQLKFGKQRSLTVNDKKEEAPFTDKISIGEGFTIGGAGYAGELRDIVVGHESLAFNYSTVRRSEGARIGREATPAAGVAAPEATTPSTRSLGVPNLTNSMQNTERCAPAGAYRFDPDAVAYGDAPHSWSHLRTDAWKRDYKLSFEFRTFHPNGVLFISSNQKLQNYVLLELRDGQLRLTVRGKKKKVPVTFESESKLNDGFWHSVIVYRKKRKVTVGVDGVRGRPARVPRAPVRNEAYVGGIDPASDYVKIKDLRDKLHQFRGCVRGFAVNDERPQAKSVRHSNTRECFPNVERGAYFDGEAYAVYSDDYRPTDVLELSFEFRTSEQNGVLLGVAHATLGVPALSVELQNGAVTMSVDMGGGGVASSVTNNLDSDFALCDDRWHNVTALYTNAELTVNVDGIRKSWVRSEETSGAAERPGAPLYVGGLPGDAPQGTLRTRESFRGCIRRLKIGDRQLDWSDMRELHGVALNSCPTSPGYLM